LLRFKGKNNKIRFFLSQLSGIEGRGGELAYDCRSRILLEPNVDRFEAAFGKYIIDKGNVASSLS
jgi:hypothetical protein